MRRGRFVDANKDNRGKTGPQGSKGSHAQHLEDFPPPPNTNDLVNTLASLIREQARALAEQTKAHNEHITQVIVADKIPTSTKGACCPRCCREFRKMHPPDFLGDAYPYAAE